MVSELRKCSSLSARILHCATPPPAPSGSKLSDSENCCGSESRMPSKFFWDMEGHRSTFRYKKTCFFSQNHILEKYMLNHINF